MGRFTLFALALFGALAVGQVAGGAATPNNELPAWSPDGATIAFHSSREGNGIWLMNADGSRERPLTSNAAGDAFPAWSPDGQKLAFTRGASDLYVVNADGTGETRLGTGLEPTWAPDGQKLAVADTGRGGLDVYTLNADGTEVTNVTDDPAWDTDPDWSPGGRKIAFVSDRSGNFDVFVMNPDGTDVKRVTRSDDWEFDPDWSPDGRRLAYAILYADGTSSIAVSGADGTGVTKLTTGFLDQQPDWSPDGRKIAFKRDSDIYVMNADGSGLAKLTGPPAAPVACVVPNVKGKTLAAARTALMAAHCTLGKVRKARSARVKRGRVISQTPKPGTRLPAAGRVSVVVSLGPLRR